MNRGDSSAPGFDALTSGIVVVACSYSIAPDLMKDKLRAMAGRCGVTFSGVVVSNRQGSDGHSDSNWDVLPGSNRTHDFSAYVEGLAHLERVRNGDGLPRVIVFVNDSLFENHQPTENFRALLRQLPLLGQVETPTIAGKVDRYATICHVNPWSNLGLYVSTYCFALNFAALPVLRGIDKLAEADGLGDHVFMTSPQWGHALSPQFRELLLAFLVYGPPAFRWSGLEHYEIGDRLLSVKARCIYFEHRLSGEIGRLGCILPTNLRKVDRLRLDLAERLARFARCIGMESV